MTTNLDGRVISANRFWSATDKTRDDWETPQNFWEWRNRIHHFDIDAAAHAGNKKTEHWFGPGSPLAEDSLALDLDWTKYGDRFWDNPTYGRMLMRWIQCFARQSTNGAFIEALLPVATSTSWFRLAYETAEAIDFLEDRLAHEIDGVPMDNSNINSMLVRWQPHGTQGSASMRLIEWKRYME